MIELTTSMLEKIWLASIEQSFYPMDSFENKKHSMAAVLDMAVGIGCKLKADDNNCIGCPLTSYLCREIRERIKDLLIDDEGDTDNE